MPQTIPLDVEELNLQVEFWDMLVTENSRKRTGLTSGLIPVREYTGYSGMEAWLRWPDILSRCDEVMDASELGAKMRGPGTQTTNAHPFALACIPFGGWRALEELSSIGLTTQVDDVEDRVRFLIDYWIRWVEPWRGDGFRSCWDAADTLRTCDPDIIDTLYQAAWPVKGDSDNRTARRFVAGLQQYLFLLYLDTRLGTGDTGPYPLPNGRHMIVREFSSLAQSWIPWSHVAADVPLPEPGGGAGVPARGPQPGERSVHHLLSAVRQPGLARSNVGVRPPAPTGSWCRWTGRSCPTYWPPSRRHKPTPTG